MRIVVTRFLTLSAENVNPEVLWVLVSIYICLVLVTLSSVFKDPGSIGGRLAWVLLILAIPVLGMVFYCLHALVVADYAFLKQFGLAPASGANRRKA